MKPEHCSLSTNFLHFKGGVIYFSVRFSTPGSPEFAVLYGFIVFKPYLNSRLPNFDPLWEKSGLAAMVSSVKWGVFFV